MIHVCYASVSGPGESMATYVRHQISLQLAVLNIPKAEECGMWNDKADLREHTSSFC